ncbi:hypothetical protein K474DRAFT_1604019, partial [Panus rudis PR-1116 ss-1]
MNELGSPTLERTPTIKQCVCVPRPAPPPAETGRPETSKEFAKCIKCVVLHGPRARPQEGGNAPNHVPAQGTHDVECINNNEEEEKDRNVPVKGTDPAQAPPFRNTDTPLSEPNPVIEAPREGVPSTNTDAFLEHVSATSEGIDLEGALRNRYVEDPFFKTALENSKQYKSFVPRDGLIFIHEQGVELLCIPDVLVNGRSAREIVILHAHSLLAHLGTYKTLGLLRDHVWWKT